MTFSGVRVDESTFEFDVSKGDGPEAGTTHQCTDATNLGREILSKPSCIESLLMFGLFRNCVNKV